MNKRAFIIVMDSFGIGGAPDAEKFGDKGSDTLAAIAKSDKFTVPTLKDFGLFNIDGVTASEKSDAPAASYARLVEVSRGKDTTVGHWEIAGVESDKALPTFPDGFPKEIIDKFTQQTGRGVLCNKPYSGTDVIRDFGEEHIKTGKLIVYTSADSVFQIAASEDIVPIETLYEYCEMARDMLTGEYAVGRVIARPFTGTLASNFERTAKRHDYSLVPPQKTVLNHLADAGLETIGVGKIFDIFAGDGVTSTTKTTSNAEGMKVTAEYLQKDFSGLCFINLVDFDMKFGHRNDVDGYANAASEFDIELKKILPLMREDDILIITADHGCDPSTPSTDHSRECVPLIIYGEKIKGGVNLGTITSFTTIAATIAEWFEVEGDFKGKSVLSKIIK